MGIRQILNLKEILDSCNKPGEGQRRWAELLKGTAQKWEGVECRVYAFGTDLLEGIAVAEQADVWMSLHGSGEVPWDGLTD